MVLISRGSDLPNGGHQAMVSHEKTQRSRGQNRARHRAGLEKERRDDCADVSIQ
jgi:hypothetical protein